MQMKKGSALEGIKVLDLGQVIAAPFCATLLRDLGADVIKVEMQGKGDQCRDSLPKKDGISTYFVNFNRGKKGITLNLKSEKGKEVLRKLIKEADVLVENFRPGVFAKLGFSYEELSKINPRLIYVAISGFGQVGPYAMRAAYDPIAQAYSGMMSITGEPEGKRVRCGASISDIMAGENATIGVLAALWHREKTGRGQMIDVALTDACIVGLSSVNQVYLTTGRVPAPLGNTYAASAPGNSYPTKDGYVVFLAASEMQWFKLCEMLGHEEWKEKPEFLTNDLRVKNKPLLDATISEVTKDYSTEDLLNLMLDAALPAAPIMTIDQVANDPHFQGVREMFTEVEHPQIGKVRITNQNFKMSETSPHVRGSSPLLGEHNQEVLASLGYSLEEIAQFEKDKVI